jgi:hypothetical protein
MQTRKPRPASEMCKQPPQESAPPYSPWSYNAKVSYASDVSNDNFL